MYIALKSSYTSVSACVHDKCIHADFFKCPRGVKQGCLLSPLMFSFVINELAVELSKNGKHGTQLTPGATEISMLLFADDIILLFSTPAGLQNQLNHLKVEADRLHLTVHLDKTNILVFRTGGHLAARGRWLYGNEEVKFINAYEYLGMTFTTKLCINFVLLDVCIKGNRDVMKIQKSTRSLSCSDPTVLWKLFDTQIEPTLIYAAEVWGLEDVDPVEKVQTFAMKRFLGVPLHSSNKLLYGEPGRYPQFIRTAVKCVKYWLKLTATVVKTK